MDDGSAELRYASHLWGESTLGTENILKEEPTDEEISVRHRPRSRESDMILLYHK